MAKYQLKKDFSIEVMCIAAPCGSSPVFTKGDVIDGVENYTTGLNKSLKSVSTSGYGGLSSGGWYYEIPIEYLEKVSETTPISVYKSSLTNTNNSSAPKVGEIKPLSQKEAEQKTLSQKEAEQKIKQSKEFIKARRKGMLELSVKASVVPIGLYAFSKYRGYDAKTTLKVTAIGSVVILGAIVYNWFSAAWGGVSFFDSLTGRKRPDLSQLDQGKKFALEVKK